MGSACCIAAKGRTSNQSTIESLHRNIRYSPSWSFRWDNRGRVVGEDITLNWSSDGVSGNNDRSDFKSRTTLETVYPSEEGSPFNSFRSHAWQKSPTSERNGENLSLPSSDPLVACLSTNSTEITEPTRLASVTYPSPALSSSTISSDGWSLPHTFDSEGFRSSHSLDLRACGVCSKLLTDRPFWGGQIAIPNGISVVSVLTCDHVFHAECLENMTLEVNKFDPACPVCTLGEKHVSKMCEKGLKAEMNSKARKRCRNQVVDIGFDGNSMPSRSSSVKSSLVKPLLRRRFSFSGSKDGECARKRGFFWTRSSKEKASSWMQK